MVLVQEQAEGKDVSAICVVEEGSEDQRFGEIAQHAYDLCRSGRLKLCGFPDFPAITRQLKEKADSSVDCSTLKVTAVVDGRLHILTTCIQKFLRDPELREEAEGLLRAHNKRFNPDAEDDMNTLDPTKKEDAEEDVASMVQRLTLPEAKDDEVKSGTALVINSMCQLLLGPAKDTLHLVVTERVALLPQRELFSFGGGTWRGGPEAQELLNMTECDYKYLVCSLKPTATIVVEKNLPEHLREFPVNTPMTVQAAERSFQDLGESKVTLMEMSPLLFILDTKRKKRSAKVTPRNFGASMCLTSLVASDALEIGWRMRPLDFLLVAHSLYLRQACAAGPKAPEVVYL
jgi:hypothetical protein